MQRCRIFSSMYVDRRLARAGTLRWIALHWMLALGVVALVTVTWRLWTPQNLFPQVPLLGVGGWLPLWLDWPLLTIFITAPILAAGATGGLSARAGTRSDLLRRNALIAFVVSGVLLVIADQHRFQPWAYQFALLALVLAFTTPNRALGLARILTIGIYLYSAWSKVDYSFLHELGPRMTAPLLGVLGIDPDMAPTWFAATLPAGETLIACGLLFRRTRTFALVASIAMHVMLLFVFSRWGLDHSWGVLLWNVYFIAQNLVLFAPLKRRSQRLRPRSSVPLGRSRRTGGIATAVVATSLVLPLGEPWGWFDVWPSWGLYASRAERSVLLLRVSTVGYEFPSAFAEHLREVPDSGGWQQLDLQEWSLSTLGAPTYPQNRFQLGVALRVAEVLPKNVDVGVLLDSQSDRWTGERRTEKHFRRPNIQRAAANYLLHVAPGRNSQANETFGP